jgi:hypothetical protein
VDILPDDLISDDETAADLGVKTTTLASWRSLGRGPDFFKVGRTVKYSRSLNKEWIAAQRRRPRTRAVATA